MLSFLCAPFVEVHLCVCPLGLLSVLTTLPALSLFMTMDKLRFYSEKSLFLVFPWLLHLDMSAWISPWEMSLAFPSRSGPFLLSSFTKSYLFLSLHSSFLITKVCLFFFSRPHRDHRCHIHFCIPSAYHVVWHNIWCTLDSQKYLFNELTNEQCCHIWYICRIWTLNFTCLQRVWYLNSVILPSTDFESYNEIILKKTFKNLELIKWRCCLWGKVKKK